MCSPYFILVAILGAISAAPVNKEPEMISYSVPLERMELNKANYATKSRQYWTWDRIKNAKPLPFRTFHSAKGLNISTKKGPDGPVTVIPEMKGDKNATEALKLEHSAKAIANGGQYMCESSVFMTNGKVVGTTWDGYDFSCSGSIIPSKTGDLIVTAGHCVFDNEAKKWNFINWAFIPAYANEYAPFGVWLGRTASVLDAWSSKGVFNADVAFVALDTYSGYHIAKALGSQKISFNQKRLQPTVSFGYPVNIDDTELLSYCTGTTIKSPYSDYVGEGLPCLMSHGCSGGPWLQKFSKTTGIGIVAGVNSFTDTNYPNIMFGPYFGSTIKSLYNHMTIK